jgi:dolichyl-phosphate-mannose-protein mannosyltransferase
MANLDRLRQPIRLKSAMKHLLIVLALSIVLLVCILPRVDDAAYGYDEADYMTAARHGVWANLWDEPSLPISDFFRLGLASVRGEQVIPLSETIRQLDDVSFQRHPHGPLYFFWLRFLQRVAGPNEAAVRGMNRVLTILNLVVIYYGALWALGGLEGFYAALTAGILFATSYTSIILNELCPHPLYITFYLAALYLLTRAIREGRRGYWLAALVAGGFALNTLVVGFIVGFVLLSAGWWNRRAWGLSPARAVRDSLYYWMPAFLTWPASLFKLSIVKSYAVMFYLAVFRKDVWGDLTLGATWRKRLAESPLEWIFLVIGLFVFTRIWRERRDVWPWIIYIGLTLAAIGGISSYGPRYVTPVVPAMLALYGVLAGPWLASLPPRRAMTVVAALAVSCGTLLSQLSNHYPIHHDQESRKILLAVDKLPRRPGMRVLAPNLAIPTLHYYFPELRLYPYNSNAEREERLTAGDIQAMVGTDGSARLVPGSVLF